MEMVLVTAGFQDHRTRTQPDSTTFILEFRHRALVNQLVKFESAVDRCVTAAIGKSHYHETDVRHGVTNVVRRIDVDGESYICRVHIDNIPWFTQEVIVLNALRQCSVPTPEVLSLDHIQFEECIVSVLVETLLPGEPMTKRLDDLDVSECVRLTRNAADLIRKINDNRPHLQPHRFETPRDVCEMTADGWLADLSPDDAEAVHAVLAESTTVPPAALIHGDFDFKHLMLVEVGNRYEISGIIDWEEARFDDPLFDLARWQFWSIEPSIVEVLGDDELTRRYGEVQDRLSSCRRRAAAGAIAWEMKYLGGVVRPTLDLVRATAHS